MHVKVLTWGGLLVAALAATATAGHCSKKHPSVHEDSLDIVPRALGDEEAALLTERDAAALSLEDRHSLKHYYTNLTDHVNQRFFQSYLHSRSGNNSSAGGLQRRDDVCLEKGEMNKCAAIFANKGVPGGVKVWNIIIEEDYRWDDVCGRRILKEFRNKCAGVKDFPVYVKDWRCDRIDYLFYGTSVNIPLATVWISFITKARCQEEWADKFIKTATNGFVDIGCVAMNLDQLPSSRDFKELRAQNKFKHPLTPPGAHRRPHNNELVN
jgi:hypothetical protein